MAIHYRKSLLLTLLFPLAVAAQPSAVPDPYLWLEEIGLSHPAGDRALDWVRVQNDRTRHQLEALPGFDALRQRLLSIYDSHDRIPYVGKHGRYFYNFWRDQAHTRGVLRRTTLAEYEQKDPHWEIVLDVDRLATDEKENWVWGGYSVLKPDNDRCLVTLSRGGTDSAVVREFDLTDKHFVADGFQLPEAKSSMVYRDRDTVYVATNFGTGSLTSSGYPRVVKEWKRGTPLSSAVTVFEGEASDVSVGASVSHDHGRVYEFVRRAPSFFTNEVLVHRGQRWVHIDKPSDAEVGTFGDTMLLTTRTPWTVANATYASGTLLSIDFDEFMKGSRAFQVLFQPTAGRSLEGIGETRSFLVLDVLANVSNQPHLLRPSNGTWIDTPVHVPPFSTVSLGGVDPNESDDYFETVSGFTVPSSLYLGTAGSEAPPRLLKQLPAFFNASNLEVSQHWVVSADGTRVPYFQVSKRGLVLDGHNRTLLNGYGGFEISMLPSYSSRYGAAWLERGGVYVLANIRGGGEFGPEWHNAARKEHRQRAYDDFAAVASDLIRRKVTSPAHLGAEGRSNGGLLMGVMLTQHPELFGAIHCGSPLLDMRRYTKLLAGASWMDEYGDPDRPEDWAYISRYSPYQNVRPASAVKYPPVLITTSTRDDRVHPGHARKLAALLEAEGQNVLYYENIEGGHGAAANNDQSAFMDALAYEFLWDRLK